MNVDGWVNIASRKNGQEFAVFKNNYNYILEHNNNLAKFRLKEELNHSGINKCDELNREVAKEWYDRLPEKNYFFPE